MDNKYKIGGKVSIIDIIIVVFIIGLIAVALKVLTPKTATADTKGTSVKYTVEITQSELGFEKNIEVGQTVYDALKGYEIGKVTAVLTEPFTLNVADFKSNEFKQASVNGYENVYFEISANANVTKESTKIGDYEIMVGKSVSIKSKTFATNGFIVKIDK